MANSLFNYAGISCIQIMEVLLSEVKIGMAAKPDSGQLVCWPGLYEV